MIRKPKTRRREYKHQKWELHLKLRDQQLNLQTEYQIAHAIQYFK